MAVEEPNIVNAEPPVVDSGIPVADPDTTPASGWQITLAAILVVAILSVFFYGVSNQRLEVAEMSDLFRDAPRGTRRVGRRSCDVSREDSH